jgi:ribosomal-protein-alanine N-acetyltransferase
MVGFIGGEIRASREQGWVTTLAVMPAYRRRGIAKALLQECEIALGTETVRLSVRASNHTAIRLYETAGYQVIDRWERYYTGGEDALVLEKRR